MAARGRTLPSPRYFFSKVAYFPIMTSVALMATVTESPTFKPIFLIDPSVLNFF